MEIKIPRKKKKRLKKDKEIYLNFIMENQKKYGFQSILDTNNKTMGFQVGINIKF
jgi:hypothetical protein